MILGLACSLFFVLGVRVRRNYDQSGTVSGKVSPNKPVLRTDADEAALEEMLGAGR